MWIVPAALILFSGCEEKLAGPAPAECHPLLATFQAASGDTVATSEGVRYVDLEVGGGAAAALGATVDVNYALYTMDGDFRESSCQGGTPVIRFLIGGNSLIPGFQIGVIGMREGGVRRVFVPTDLAYPPGSRDPFGQPHDLAGLDLIFDIQLVDQI